MSTKKDALPLVGQAVLFSQDPRVVFYGGKVPLTTKDGRMLCCLAQRGECRYNSRHHGSGSSSDTFWSLPQVEPHCDRRCDYRVEVADPKTDTNCRSVESRWDPCGFTYYKGPSDACQYQKPEGEVYTHDAKTCPQCSQPQVEPSDEWVDVVMVEQYAGRNRTMRGVFKMDDKEYDLIEGLSATAGTKAAIRAKLAEQGNSDEE